MLDRITRWVGPLPARPVAWALAALFSLWIALDVGVFHLSIGLSRPAYDAMVRARMWSAPADPRIVVLDIDEASLARMAPEFGRWPWPRDTLATVLEHVEAQQPAAIVWDIMFSDPDRLNPGGDAAFEAAARQSIHSHFPVIRLPAANDGASQLTYQHLPGLWAVQGRGTATVAAVTPGLASVAASRLGFNNATPDRDGVLRRYQYSEVLSDGGVLQSIPLAVLRMVEPEIHRERLLAVQAHARPDQTLIAWRGTAGAYPRVPFWQVFAQAEGQPQALASFKDKIVLIGSTAPSLHDIHPTPLSPLAPGVDSLATVIDNALHRRHKAELPRPVQAAVGIALCLLLAGIAQQRSLAALDPLLFVLPGSLLVVSYLSLHVGPMFVDLQLPAGLALVFMAVLRAWNGLRRDYWCNPPEPVAGRLAVWTWLRAKPWQDGALDRVMDALQRHAPNCRLVVSDAQATWPLALRWPELARHAAIVGPADELLAARDVLRPTLERLAPHSGAAVVAPAGLDREQLAALCAAQWAQLHKPGTLAQAEEVPT